MRGDEHEGHGLGHKHHSGFGRGGAYGGPGEVQGHGGGPAFEGWGGHKYRGGPGEGYGGGYIGSYGYGPWYGWGNGPWYGEGQPGMPGPHGLHGPHGHHHRAMHMGTGGCPTCGRPYGGGARRNQQKALERYLEDLEDEMKEVRRELDRIRNAESH
ncbi:MAG: hypothetical protein ACYC6I_02180 [Bacillota bacterium]